MKKVWLLALFPLIIPYFFYPFIYEGVILKRWQPEVKRFHYFVGLSDFHDKKHESTHQQRLCIQTMLQRLDKQTTKILVEDLCTAQDNCSKSFCGPFKINASGGILGGLTKLCTNKGFHVENVEYRYCRVAALGPLLSQPYQKLHECPSASKLLVRDIAQEVSHTMNNVTGPLYLACLAQAAQKTSKKIADALKELNICPHSADSIATYIERRSNQKNCSALVERLLTFDADLLDIKLVSSVLAKPKRQTVLAFAGGSHIARVTDMLLAMGYILVYKLNAPVRKEQKVNVCISVPTRKKSLFLKPEPINLKLFQQELYQRVLKNLRPSSYKGKGY